MRRNSTLLLATLLLGPTCAPIDPDIALEPFSDCAQMRDTMARMARKEALYDYRFRGVFNTFLMGCSDFALVGGDKNGSGDTGGASSYSTTNVQEAGVDESDLVKTDGTWLYSLSGTHLVVSRAWPVEDLSMVATVAIDGGPTGLYLYGDLVVVESTVWGETHARSGARPARTEGGDVRTVLTLIDVSDPTQPQVMREIYAEGQLVESRRIEERLFVVSYLDLSVDLRAENAREAKKAIDDALPEAWMPWVMDSRLVDGQWQSEERPACECTDVWASERQGGTWLSSALSLDLDDPASNLVGTAVVGEAHTVYASPSSLYIAASEVQEGPFPSIDDSLQTIVHKFELQAGEDKPGYAASAKVQGVLEDRFGMSEYEGVLRIATTESDAVSSALVSTLREEGGAFTLLDSLGGLGEGEEIYATRFVGDIGYVVTAEMIDPLFTLDLSDPSDIRLGGTLVMDGWSDYLHPMDEDHLLSVGVDGHWNLQVSLFDVSDLAHPSLVDRLPLDAWGSESQYEPHAFNYFAAQDALVIPAWSEGDQPVLEVIDVQPTGLSYVGRLDQDEIVDAIPEAWSCAPIRRSVIFEDLVMAISNGGLTVAALDSPAETVQAEPFLGLDPCEEYEGQYGDWD